MSYIHFIDVCLLKVINKLPFINIELSTEIGCWFQWIKCVMWYHIRRRLINDNYSRNQRWLALDKSPTRQQLKWLLDIKSKEMLLSSPKAHTTIGLMKISEFFISVCLKMNSRRLMDSIRTIDLLIQQKPRTIGIIHSKNIIKPKAKI